MSPRPRTTSDQAILRAALRAVTRIGPMRLTLADVAREARVSPATLVQRFGSKRQLLLALMASSGDEANEQWASIAAVADQSPLAGLYAYADCMAGLAPTPDVLANHLSFLQMDLLDPEFHEQALTYARDTQRFLRRTLETAVRRRELSACDTARLARAVQAVIGGSMMQWAIDRRGTLRKRLREDLETLLRPQYVRGRAPRTRIKIQR